MSRAYELMEAEEAEVTMEQAFAMALTDEDDILHDVTLEGSDGLRVPAMKGLLALRSKVFRKMLYGDFQESSQDVVKVDYPGAVILAIVEYIHTNNAEILVQPSVVIQPNVDMDVAEEDSNKEDELLEDCREVFQTLLTLTAAAAYYNLPKLCHKTHVCLSSYMDRFPELSYAVVESLAQHGAAISEKIKQQALLKIRQCLSLGSNGHGVEVLSSSAMELVLSDNKVIIAHRYRFQLIEMWSSIAGADQQGVAKSLIEKHVKLDLIDPDFLSTEVTNSGLVTTEQLLGAFQRQAKRAKQDFNIAFDSNIVSKPVWKTTESILFQVKGDLWKGDAIQGLVLSKNHSYQWTIQISSTTTRAAAVWLGVMASTAAAEISSAYCGNLEQSWGIYGLEGREWSSKKQGELLGDDAKFASGSSVVVTLDLSPEEENNGSLSISVDGKPVVLVLGNMRSKLNGPDGFVPAVSCRRASTTILRMKQM